MQHNKQIDVFEITCYFFHILLIFWIIFTKILIYSFFNRTRTRYIYSILFLLKRACNLQLSHCVGPSHQKCNTHAHTQTPTQHFSFQFKVPHTSPTISIFFIHSFCTCPSLMLTANMCFTLFTFFTLYPQNNPLSALDICANQLEQTEKEKA